MNIKYSLVFVCTLLLMGCGNKSISNEKGPLVYEETDIDLGDIVIEDGAKNLEFHLLNNGEKAFFIQTVVTSCDCTEAEYNKEFVYRGKGTTIKVKFDPSTLNEGAFERMIGVYSSIKQCPDTLYIHGVAKHKKK